MIPAYVGAATARAPSSVRGPGVSRLLISASDSNNIVGGNLQRTLSKPGWGLVYSRAENAAGDELYVYATGSGVTGPSPLVLPRGSRLRFPWPGDGLTVKRFGSTHDLVLYVFESEEADYIEGLEDPSRGSTPSGFLHNGTDLTTLTGAPASASDGVAIDGMSKLTVTVVDGNGTSSVGTVLRYWWYVPNFDDGAFTWQLAEEPTAAAGWVPDVSTDTVAVYVRQFTKELAVRTGGGPAQYSFPNTAALSGARLLIQASSIPGGAKPLLYVTAEALP
jgi:hypothetical protein